MSRPLRILASGALYHVMSRGNAKGVIFLDDVDRHRFLAIMATTVERYQVECHAYCLMSNHYHLILRTWEPNLSSAVQYLNGVYAGWWNRRHSRVGHVLQGRFKGQLIQRDGYFLEACRYVVLNPVRAGLVGRAEDWEWSSYRATAGLAPRPGWLTTMLVLGGRTAAAQRAYQEFVLARATEEGLARAMRSDAPVIGNEEFVAAYRDAIEQAHPTDVVRRVRALGRPTLSELFDDVPDKATRDVRIRMARDRYLYRVSEIASHVSLHYASVSRIAAAQGPARSRARGDRRTGRTSPARDSKTA